MVLVGEEEGEREVVDSRPDAEEVEVAQPDEAFAVEGDVVVPEVAVDELRGYVEAVDLGDDVDQALGGREVAALVR